MVHRENEANRTNFAVSSIPPHLQYYALDPHIKISTADGLFCFAHFSHNSHTHSPRPVGALIKKRTYFELLLPDEDAWKALVLDFLRRKDVAPAWRNQHQAGLEPVLARTQPRPGNVVQLTWDEPFTDALGGMQRVQVSVLYFRWRTEEFREVSAGFLGILAMTSAVDMRPRLENLPPPRKARHDPPLQMDATAMRKIYDDIAPHMRLRPMDSHLDMILSGGSKKSVSRQLRFRDDDGVWKTVNVM
jgi:hypothetical protein